MRSRGGPIPPRTLPSARPQPRTTSRRTLDGAANPPAPTNPGTETPDPRRTLFFCRGLLSGSRAGGALGHRMLVLTPVGSAFCSP